MRWSRATRTRGATVNIIEKLKNDFKINWIEKNQANDKNLQFAENNKKAFTIIKVLEESISSLNLTK